MDFYNKILVPPLDAGSDGDLEEVRHPQTFSFSCDFFSLLVLFLSPDNDGAVTDLSFSHSSINFFFLSSVFFLFRVCLCLPIMTEQ